MRPLVAVSAWMEEARWLRFQGKVALLEQAYLARIEEAGGIPVIVPPDRATAADIVTRIDALVIGGGGDVDPALYCQPREAATVTAGDARQDEGEISLAQAAIARDLPVLAICRGCQVLNVLYGGSLIQDVAATSRSAAHLAAGPEDGSEGFVRHGVSTASGSRLAAILGEEFEVPSWHHQAIAEAGAGLRVVGRADDDLIEAVEDPEREFVLGVQWHPEVASSNELFEALIEAARARLSRPSVP